MHLHARLERASVPGYPPPQLGSGGRGAPSSGWPCRAAATTPAAALAASPASTLGPRHPRRFRGTCPHQTAAPNIFRRTDMYCRLQNHLGPVPSDAGR